jgi:preprotein translocase subunit SecA
VVSSLITKIFGTKFDRDVKRIRPIVEEINQICEKLADWPDEKLVERTRYFQAELKELRDELRQQFEHEDLDKEERRKRFREEIDGYLETILPEASGR